MNWEELEFRKIPVDRGLMWFLIGPEGAASFYLQRVPDIPGFDEHLTAQMRADLGIVTTDAGRYSGLDLGVHYREPHGSFSRMEECLAWDGGCWYDGSSLAGIQLGAQWAEGGFDEGIIKAALQGVYGAEFL